MLLDLTPTVSSIVARKILCNCLKLELNGIVSVHRKELLLRSQDLSCASAEILNPFVASCCSRGKGSIKEAETTSFLHCPTSRVGEGLVRAFTPEPVGRA